MTKATAFKRPTSNRCAIYTRKSTEEGLQQDFNSLDAQRESGEAYVASQRSEGWECLPDRYDDGGFTGGNMDRPALKRLMKAIESGKVDTVVVYKVDRLSRSLLDFAKMMETFDRHNISFVSVTQLINTATSMGRLMLNVLLSFAQFEREIISERTRDKIAAARRKGKWSGGLPLLGYTVVDTKLVVAPDEAEQVQQIYELYLQHDGLLPVVQELNRRGWRTKRWTTKKGIEVGGKPFDKNNLYYLLTNVTYSGKIKHKQVVYEGEHQALLSDELWRRVQAKLQRNGKSGGAEVRNRFGATLKGLLRCQACACAMTPSHATRNGNRRYRYYLCSAAQKRGRGSCPSPSIPAGEIERFVVEQIKCIGLDPRIVESTVRQAQAQLQLRIGELTAEEARLRRDLVTHHGDLQQLARHLSGDTLTAARLADVQERIRSSEQRLTQVQDEGTLLSRELIGESDVARALTEFDSVWEALTPCEQGRLLHLLIERIDYDGASGTISITFHASGIKELARQEAEGNAA